MEYSYFIKRNIKFFNNNGYTLYPPALKNLSEFIYERKARLMEANFREELKKNKDNQNERRKL